jgi:Leucine-rich repeat (LRR) protein
LSLENLPKGLRFLDISRNDHLAAVDRIGELHMLERLNISNTPITELPENMSYFSNLKSLLLEKLNLRSLRPVGDLASLEWLNLKFLTAEDLKEGLEEIAKLPNLKYIEVQRGSEIDQVLTNLLQSRGVTLFRA